MKERFEMESNINVKKEEIKKKIKKWRTKKIIIILMKNNWKRNWRNKKQNAKSKYK
jgi:hypothetical protein